jgi:hypothetical protein
VTAPNTDKFYHPSVRGEQENGAQIRLLFLLPDRQIYCGPFSFGSVTKSCW